MPLASPASPRLLGSTVLADALALGWTILTGNQRAARTLRQAYNAQKRTEANGGWQPPTILAWDTWLALLWRRLIVEGRASALLLNSQQEHFLWREIVSADKELGASLRSPDSLAELAASGWQVLSRYGARRELRRHAESADTRAFTRWVSEFERWTARDALLSRAQLPHVLGEAFAKGEFAAEGLRGILLVGFDRKTPDQELLLATATAAGVPIDEIARASISERRQIVGAGSEQAELEVCARWARNLLIAKPESRVCVIVPRLAEVRSKIERTFREILAPELEDIGTGDAAAAGTPWEFSLGVPLASTGLGSAALDLLDWANGPLEAERTSRLLLSPYIAGGTEYLARAEFDAFSLRSGFGLLPEVSIEQFVRLMHRSRQREDLPELLRRGNAVERLLERVKPETGERSYAAWCTVFGQVLEAWGWSGDGPDSSVEFQTRRRWAGALDELASLDFTGRTASYAAAVKELRRIAQETLFAPESHGARVQVMGPLEAAGSTFEAVWFLGAGDLSWPESVAPHPLIPLSLQREHAMPGVNPDVETAAAKAIAERVTASAGEVVFSYARETPDSYQRPSPALIGLELDTIEIEELVGPSPTRLPVLLEKLADEAPLPELPDRVVRGGSQILGLQAACGFRAFAEKRLHSQALDDTDAGLDAMERGDLVHTVLEAVWRELGTQAALRLLTHAERRELLTRCIDQALVGSTENEDAGWSAAYIDTERERLLRLLGLWLERELDRPAFVVALREERVNDVSIGPLRLEVRLDRVDVLVKDGEPAGEIVLDYKTGSVKPSDWKGERPDDPQVPLYALARKPEELVGVAFGSVRPGNGMSVSGLQGDKNVLTTKGGSVVDLRAQVEEWREVLTALAEEYAAGNAAVSPKQYPTTCRYCEQRMLCRLDPKTLEPENLEDLADPEYDAEAEIA